MQLSSRSLALAFPLLFGLAACVSLPSQPVEINLVAMNDFHGNLEAHDKVVSENGQRRKLRLGGIENVAGAIAAWRKEDPQLVVVGAGDLIGASPAMSAIWADEPTLEGLGMAGLTISSVGNHEFDRGTVELLRQQYGGCVSPMQDKACKWRPDYAGAKFSYLAANVIDRKTGKTLLPAYRIEEIKGVKIGFIGAVVRDTANMVIPAGITGVEFIDEVEGVNRASAELQRQGVQLQVLLIHEGVTAQALEKLGCDNLNGPIINMLPRFDPRIRVVVSGHSHNDINCRIGDRYLTQAEAYGHTLTRIKMRVDPRSGALLEAQSHNVDISPDKFTPVPALQGLLEEVRQRSGDVLARPIARLGAPRIAREPNAAGESPIGAIATDAQLAATAPMGAQIAIINHASLRSDLESGPDGANYGQIAASHPYNNTLVLMSLSGAQIVTLLEQQRLLNSDGGDRRTLQVSQGFTFTWDAKKPRGQRIVPGSVRLHGEPLDMQKKYRVTVNNFMAQGGDGYTVLKDASDVIDTGILDIDAFIAYLVAQDKAGKPAGSDKPAGRVTRLN